MDASKWPCPNVKPLVVFKLPNNMSLSQSSLPLFVPHLSSLYLDPHPFPDFLSIPQPLLDSQISEDPVRGQERIEHLHIIFIFSNAKSLGSCCCIGFRCY